jgi:uncharacterized membrane protein
VNRFALLLVLAGPLFLGLTAPARAQFSVCNRTMSKMSVAIGYFDGKNWDSAGWWNVDFGKCEVLIRTALNARYYYLYAIHPEIGGSWDGDRSFCVKDGGFTIHGRQDCLALGYDVKRFFQVDTGNSVDWTENLAD